MFTTVKSLTAKYLLAALLVSGVFFGFSQAAFAAENNSGDPVLATQGQVSDNASTTPSTGEKSVDDKVVTLNNVAKITDNGAVIIPPGHHQVKIGYVNGKQAILTGSTVVAGMVAVVVADPNERLSDQADTVTGQNDQTEDEALSDQHEFNTLVDDCTTNCGGGDEAVSDEHDFDTDPDTCTANCTPNEEAVSGQHDFNTPGDTCTTNCGGGDEAVSEQHDFNTPNDGCTTNCGGDDEVVSEQHDFNTNKDDNGGGGGGGCVGCGGGGSGGTGGGIIPPGGLLPPGCKPFLLKFIRYGYNNDPYEVRKLQAFLDVFEGYKLPITGIYDRETEQAVRAFQSKYASDVLVPWGITDNTGYVFITTMLKINYIYCGITTPIDVDLRSRFPGFEIGPGGLQEIENNFEQPNAVPLPVPEVGQGNNFLQLAAAGLLKGLNWLWSHLCWLAWLLVLILLAIIAYLLMRLRELKQRLANYENPDGGMTEAGSLAAVAAPTIAAIPLVDALEEDDQSLITEPEGDDWQDYLEDGVTPIVPIPMTEAGAEPEPEAPVESVPQATEKTADYENDLKALLDALADRNDKSK